VRASASGSGGAANEIVVRTEGLSKSFGSFVALKQIDLTVHRGEVAVVIGPSGSGKSTLLRCINRLEEPSGGRVFVGGVELTDRSVNLNHARRDIGFVFQSFNLLPTLSAEENVLLPLAIAGRKPERDVVDELMEKMGLAERRDHKPAQLSGGQQQRVAVARALICTPTVLFADEPTGNLDSAAGAGVLGLLRSAVDEDGQTTVMVTHDARAAATADRVLFLADGRVVADLEGASEERILGALKDAVRA